MLLSHAPSRPRQETQLDASEHYLDCLLEADSAGSPVERHELQCKARACLLARRRLNLSDLDAVALSRVREDAQALEALACSDSPCKDAKTTDMSRRWACIVLEEIADERLQRTTRLAAAADAVQAVMPPRATLLNPAILSDKTLWKELGGKDGQAADVAMKALNASLNEVAKGLSHGFPCREPLYKGAKRTAKEMMMLSTCSCIITTLVMKQVPPPPPSSTGYPAPRMQSPLDARPFAVASRTNRQVPSLLAPHLRFKMSARARTRSRTPGSTRSAL